MTNEQIRIKVAGAVGWRNVGLKGFGSSDLVGASPSDPRWPYSPIPDYPNSLDACAEFEKTLKDDEKTDYIRLLNKGDFSYRRLAFATALQRCEAFLRCLGLWEEPASGAKEEVV